jgi:hypothetical protein
MSETGKQGNIIHPGLARINFPGVHIEDKRLLFLFINTLQGHSGKPVGKQPEVPSPGNRNLAAQD